MSGSFKDQVPEGLDASLPQPCLSQLLKVHFPKVLDRKFSHYEKLPNELQFKILEYALVEGNPIEVVNYIAQNEFFAGHSYFWDNWEEFLSFVELAHILPEPSSPEFGTTTPANEWIMMRLIEKFFSRGGTELWATMTYEHYLSLQEHMWAIVFQLRWNPKLKKTSPKITTGLFQVSRKMGYMARETFYKKNNFVLPLGFPFAQIWLTSIGGNRQFIRNMKIQLPNIPSSFWVEEDIIKSNLVGWLIDQDTQHLGLQQFPHLKTDRLLQSVSFFKRFCTESPNSLRVLTLYVSTNDVYRWLDRKLEHSGPIPEDPDADHPLDELLGPTNRSDEASTDRKKPFNFKINFVIESSHPVATDHLLHDIETNEFFAAISERFQWGEVTIEKKYKE